MTLAVTRRSGKPNLLEENRVSVRGEDAAQDLKVKKKVDKSDIVKKNKKGKKAQG